MEKEPNFFALIIGTEILNRRREDKHFDFLSTELLKRGYKLKGSFVIEDDPSLIIQTLKFLASIPKSVIFSFGGIGSTPDDHTRKCAAVALRDGMLIEHTKAADIIKKNLGERAYPYPIKMAQLPKRAKLLHNPVNNMPAFYLDDRYFFMPGFPQMSHPMVEWILDNIFPEGGKKRYRRTLQALCRESQLIDVMESLPKDIELSSLPKLYSDGSRVSISLSGTNKQEVERYFQKFIDKLQKENISYSILKE